MSFERWPAADVTWYRLRLRAGLPGDRNAGIDHMSLHERTSAKRFELSAADRSVAATSRQAICPILLSLARGRKTQEVHAINRCGDPRTARPKRRPRRWRVPARAREARVRATGPLHPGSGRPTSGGGARAAPG